MPAFFSIMIIQSKAFVSISRKPAVDEH